MVSSIDQVRILITGGSGFIGTNLMDFYLAQGTKVLNVDWNPPYKVDHMPYWQECDILNSDQLVEIATGFSPTIVIHLAARTDTDIYDLNGDLNEYIQNTEGTKNVLLCVQKLNSVQRLIITSSMFVCKAGYVSKNEEDFNPFTLYGVSKVLTEQYTREASLSCTWTIIRPQTIWGPWSMRYTQTLFKVMKKGLYFHPDKKNVYRAYGYVGNVVWQINQILEAPHNKVHQRVLYVGDRPINLLEWVQCVSQRLTKKPVRIIPASVVKSLALLGDSFKKANISFPITTTRYNSMVEDYLTPVEKTFSVLGEPPYSLQEGVDHFVNWAENENDLSNISEREAKITVAQMNT